jgi:hypothetical protein
MPLHDDKTRAVDVEPDKHEQLLYFILRDLRAIYGVFGYTVESYLPPYTQIVKFLVGIRTTTLIRVVKVYRHTCLGYSSLAILVDQLFNVVNPDYM